MKNNIFIPKLCKVGFNTREDTYTKKLGYIIYNDGKVWRKEKSWESWREKYITQEEFDRQKQESYNEFIKRSKLYYADSYSEYSKQTKEDYVFDTYKNYARSQEYKDSVIKNAKEWLENNKTFEDYCINRKISTSIENYQFDIPGATFDKSIEPIEFENVPTEGFVLNRKAGGYSSGWNHRSTYCRVYDPRGFEFEISIPNLLYILENANCIKGKGLEGKFIYGWDGKDLVLVPEQSVEYKEMVEFTNLRDLKVKKRDLKVGYNYICSDNVIRTYMGEYYEKNLYGVLAKKLWFADNNKELFFTTLTIKSVKKELGVNFDFANLFDKFKKTDNLILGEPEYELCKSVELPKDSYRYKYYCEYLKDDENNFKPVCFYYESYSPSPHFRIGGDKFNDFESLLTKYELWQLKTTK